MRNNRRNPDADIRELAHRFAAGEYNILPQLLFALERSGDMSPYLQEFRNYLTAREPRGPFEQQMRGDNYPSRGRGWLIFFDNPTLQQAARELQARLALLEDKITEIGYYVGSLDPEMPEASSSYRDFQLISGHLQNIHRKFFDDMGNLAAGLSAWAIDPNVTAQSEVIPPELPWRPDFRDTLEEYLYQFPFLVQHLEEQVVRFCQEYGLTLTGETRPNPALGRVVETIGEEADPELLQQAEQLFNDGNLRLYSNQEIAAVYVNPQGEVLAAVAHTATPVNDEVELSVVTRSDSRHSGLATLLLQHMVNYWREIAQDMDDLTLVGDVRHPHSELILKRLGFSNAGNSMWYLKL